MWSEVVTLMHAMWAWLPEVTVGLQFAEAVLALIVTARRSNRPERPDDEQ